MIGLFVLCATLHDGWRTFHNTSFDTKVDSKSVTILHCFSFLSNGRKLLSMRKNSSGGTDLGCLYGIRVLSTLWVVIFHTWNFNFYFTHNLNSIKDDAMSWWFQGIALGTVAVDSFLVMSGLLVSYLLLKELDRNQGKINVFMFYLHRYLR